MHPSADAIETFIAAADLGSFSAAARHLGRSQSTVSVTIANLEVDLGLVLFERSGRRPELTPAGRALLPKAAAILAGYAALAQGASQLVVGA
jgi:DNA-binding transcriptional LysR family regulator